MKPTKKRIAKSLLSLLGCISMPVESTPANMTVSQPSVVIISKRLSIALPILSKLDLLFRHLPPKLMQSHLDITKSIFAA